MEAGCREELDDFLGAELAEAAAVLALPVFQGFFEEVFTESHGELGFSLPKERDGRDSRGECFRGWWG